MARGETSSPSAGGGRLLPAGVMVGGPLPAEADPAFAHLVEETLAAFAFIVQSSDDAIFQVGADGRILTWNPGASRLTGYSEAQVLGQEPSFLFPAHRRASEATLLRRALDGERIDRRETELERRHGMLVPVEMTISPLRAGGDDIVGAAIVARDITEQKLAQEALAESQARLLEAQELAAAGLWSWDSDTDEVQWSEPLHRILGVDPREFDGTLHGFVEQFEPESRAEVRASFERARATGRSIDFDCGIGYGATARWFSVRGDPVRDSSERMVGLRGIVQDLTDRHQAAEALREALARERLASERLREADQLKDEFLATVSHELRTPLTAIVGFASLLLHTPTDDDSRTEILHRVLHNAHEMQRMIEGLLDFSRLESGRYSLSLATVDVGDALDACVHSTEPAVAQHRVEVEVDDALSVYVDPDAFRRIVINLLTNAAKFSPAGSTIRVTARRHEDRGIISVSDQGPGIDPVLQPRVFERFFQVHDAQPTGRRGTGVGLAIVKRFAEMLGGEVWLESQLGGGSTFSVSLPTEGP